MPQIREGLEKELHRLESRLEELMQEPATLEQLNAKDGRINNVLIAIEKTKEDLKTAKSVPVFRFYRYAAIFLAVAAATAIFWMLFLR